MATKLKLTIRRIPWSLVLRAGFFGLGWLLLPYEVFFLGALYLYFVPMFQPRKLALPFLLLLLFSYIETPSLWSAIVMSATLYLILGIKDLVFIDRVSAYELLILLIIFLGGLHLFSSLESPDHSLVFLAPLVFISIFFFLFKNFLYYPEDSPSFIHGFLRERGIWIGVLASFVLWQYLLFLLVLPLNFFYQTALIFIIALLFLEILPYYVRGNLSRDRILANLSLSFFLSLCVVTSASWTL